MKNSIVKILSSYTKINSIKSFFSNFYIIFSRYDCFFSNVSERDSIILFVGFEKVFRSDHFGQLNVIFSAINYNLRRASLLGFKRKFTVMYLWDFLKLRSVNKLALRQMEDALNGIKLQRYKKCLVQCDIVPIQAFMVQCCNGANVETFSLQHGFYPPPDSSAQWLTEYQCSESGTLFAWDIQTISFFKSVKNKKTFIYAGPFCSTNQLIIPKDSDDERIVVFLPSKNDVKYIDYIVEVGKGYEEYGIDVVHVCHPNFSQIDKFILERKKGIKVESKGFKSILQKNDICFVLNSSVWVELELSSIKTIVLDVYFSEDRIFNANFSELKNHVNIFYREPFMMGCDSVQSIANAMVDV